MDRTSETLLTVVAIALATQAAAQVTLYGREGFRGRAVQVNSTVPNLGRVGFNDLASSVIVDRGRWEVCEHAQFEGRCVVLRPGSYDSLARMGMSDRISSVRPVGRGVQYQGAAPVPLPAPTYAYRQRPGERLYEVPVTWAHAIMGPPGQRCWVERQDVGDDRAGLNVPGAVVGAIIGGVLGHQLGDGRGRDVATAGGAVAGAALGARAGGGDGRVYSRDVQRCAMVPGSMRPDHWDIGYEFRGVRHRVQMSGPPGPTITVNGNGEPRG